MRDRMQVREGEGGLVRVFAVDVDPGEDRLWRDPDDAEWQLPFALGVDRLDPVDVQVFRAGEMEEIGLSGLLSAGHGVGEAQLADDRDRLDAETGLIAVIRSAAFDAPVELSPHPPLRLLGVYAEPSPPAAPPGPVGDYASARPGPAGSPPDEGVAESPDGPPDGPPQEVFRPDRDRYIRDHLWLAAVGMAGATAVLWALGNAEYWVGAVAALLAVAVRGWYLASEELARTWELTPAAIRAVGPDGRHERSVPLTQVARVRELGSAVQIITRGGDKMLLKYMAEGERVRDRIAAAAGVGTG
ncbi:MAG: hypothetical protein HLUCCA09_03175 [Rhodobacteraceae bacterium HLUCCA09]|nr:MAG: hypothetical protein HLUCCA09_03175 [Rhodobacteraceae bacterium HLUCCA09]